MPHGWRFKAPFFAYFLWRSKESKCRPAQGSMKIKSKVNIKPAVAKAVGTPTREHANNRRPAQGSMKMKSKANIKPAVAKAVGTPTREHANNRRPAQGQ